MIPGFPLPTVPTQPPTGSTVQLNDSVVGSGLRQFQDSGVDEDFYSSTRQDQIVTRTPHAPCC
ncbi:hypothetical protein ACN28S_14020 [Cystobacter fuscus]